MFETVGKRLKHIYTTFITLKKIVTFSYQTGTNSVFLTSYGFDEYFISALCYVSLNNK